MFIQFKDQKKALEKERDKLKGELVQLRQNTLGEEHIEEQKLEKQAEKKRKNVEISQKKKERKNANVRQQNKQEKRHN